MADRDPRVEPMPGDVIINSGMKLEVTDRGLSVHYRLTNLNPGCAIDRIPMTCNSPLERWKKLHQKRATVLHRAEEIANG